MRRFRIRSRLVPAVLLTLLFGGLLAGVVVLALGKPDRGRLDIVGTDTVQRVYGGVEQDGASLGPPGARVSVSVYDDLQCASCATWYLRTVPPLVEALVRSKRADLVYHHFPMGERDTEAGFYAAAAAGMQGRQWQYVHIFFANQEIARRHGVTEQFMTRVAEQVPELDVRQWRSDRRSGEVATTLKADSKLALDLRLPAQPAVVVDGPKGTRKLTGSPTVAAIEAAVRAVS
jgi:protein-disulfide isomerase